MCTMSFELQFDVTSEDAKWDCSFGLLQLYNTRVCIERVASVNLIEQLKVEMMQIQSVFGDNED